MKVLHVKGNGSCLYISLRLGLEYKKILKTYEENGTVFGNLNGFDSRVCESAEKLRDIICQWYSAYLQKELPAFGKLNEGSDKIWTRGDLLLCEAHNIFDKLEVPEDALGRTQVMLRYLKYVSVQRTWGGQAEYVAFAFLAKLNVEVYDRSGKLLNNINPPNSVGTVKILFTGSSHYDLLIDDEDAVTLNRLGFKI
jgi:hypothetical protein